MKQDQAISVDAHQHFWCYDAREQTWMTDDMSCLRRDFLPGDLGSLLEGASIDYSVVVQARQDLGEAPWLLELAEQNDFIGGVVGWVDLCSAEVSDQLEELAGFAKFKGVRHIVEGEADDRFILRDDFCRGVGQLGRFGLSYDVLIRPRHIKYAAEMMGKFPDQAFVVDHLGKPDIGRGQIQPWRQEMEQIARMEHVYCKLSGMVTEACWHDWKRDDFLPYMKCIVEMFGPRRVMFGSDWPVCLLAGGYEEVVEIVERYLGKLSEDERAAVRGGTALDFYRISV